MVTKTFFVDKISIFHDIPLCEVSSPSDLSTLVHFVSRARTFFSIHTMPRHDSPPSHRQIDARQENAGHSPGTSTYHGRKVREEAGHSTNRCRENASHSLNNFDPLLVSDLVEDSPTVVWRSSKRIGGLSSNVRRENAGHSLDNFGSVSASVEDSPTVVPHRRERIGLSSNRRSLSVLADSPVVDSPSKEVGLSSNRREKAGHSPNDFDSVMVDSPKNEEGDSDFSSPGDYVSDYTYFEAPAQNNASRPSKPINLCDSDSNSNHSATLLATKVPGNSDLSFDPFSSREITKEKSSRSLKDYLAPDFLDYDHAYMAARIPKRRKINTSIDTNCRRPVVAFERIRLFDGM